MIATIAQIAEDTPAPEGGVSPILAVGLFLLFVFFALKK